MRSRRRHRASYVALVVVLGGCGTPSTPSTPSAPSAPSAPPPPRTAATPAAPTPGPACDPMSSSRPVARDGALPAPVCGNRVLDLRPGACVERCAGGCGQPIQCRVECADLSEPCDGDAFTAGTTCEGQGYAGGAIRCTSSCTPDLAACTDTVPAPGLLRRSLPVVGDTAHVVAVPARTVLFAFDGRGRALTGVVLDAKLRSRRRLPRLRIAPVATGGLGERLAFVNRDDRFGTVSVTGEVTWLGTLAATSSIRYILPDLVHPGRGVIASMEPPRRSFALVDPPEAPVDPIRWFGLDDVRIAVVDGAHPIAQAAGTQGKRLVVFQRAARASAFVEVDGLLEDLPAAPTAFRFSDSRHEIDDTAAWPGGAQRVTYKRKVWLHDHPPTGLSYNAIAGADVVTAFRGTLFARMEASGPARRVALYWVPIVNPLTPTFAPR